MGCTQSIPTEPVVHRAPASPTRGDAASPTTAASGPPQQAQPTSLNSGESSAPSPQKVPIAKAAMTTTATATTTTATTVTEANSPISKKPSAGQTVSDGGGSSSGTASTQTSSALQQQQQAQQQKSLAAQAVGATPISSNIGVVRRKKMPFAVNTGGRSASTGGSLHGMGRNNSSASATPETRTRADSWAVNTSNRPSVEAQWKYLWETQSAAVVDPADVPAVLDTLLSKMINRLSATQMTLIQRKVRATMKALPTKKSTSNPAASKMIKVVLGNTSANISNVNAGATVAEATEARTVAEKYHLLTDTVVQALLPKLFPLPSISGGNNSSAVSIAPQAIQLMLHLTPSTEELLWKRVANVAQSAAKAAGLEMDVNKKALAASKTGSNNYTTTNSPMPKPSQVPDLAQPPDLPIGVSLPALSCIMAMAVSGTRSQQLQLLFYLCMDVAQLSAFLASHPAGGVPVWLLEVDQGVLVSLASLTHYHYYGHAFLPCSDASATAPQPLASFVASTSRKPVQLQASAVLSVVRASLHACLVGAKQHQTQQASSFTAHVISPNNAMSLSTQGAESSSTQQQSNATLSGSQHSRQNSIGQNGSRTKKAAAQSSTGGGGPTNGSAPVGANGTYSHSLTHNESNVSNNGGPGTVTASADASNHQDPSIPITPRSSDLMSRLQEISESNMEIVVDVEVEAALTKLEHGTAICNSNKKATWTLEDYAEWADMALDDFALHMVMHRLFATGTLPSPILERELVLLKWEEWEQSMKALVAPTENDLDLEKKPNGREGDGGTIDVITQSVKALFDSCTVNGASSTDLSRSPSRFATVWGGLGGIDGGGGMGRGVLYCVDKQWWDQWAAYVGWSFVGDRPIRKRSLKRPSALSNERLLDRESDPSVSGGSLGFYELMKIGLKRDADYVLVPPGVWDILYETYGGGPPLPRMIRAQERKFSDANRLTFGEASESNNFVEASSGDELDSVIEELGSSSVLRVLRLPESLSVSTHPWVIHCHMCDPLQPYRRGEAGTMSIRVMVTPDQPLWRLYAETIARLPLQVYKAFDATGRGKARLWKKTEPTGPKDPVLRYGPWSLLCKSRSAILPLLSTAAEMEQSYASSVDNWIEYTDNATVESVGLTSLAHLMLEFAVQNKNGDLMWPREAAANAGRVRRIAEEDMKFRQIIQGVDSKGNLLLKPPNLVGMEVDAMDSTGKWYPVRILEIDIVDDEGEGAQDESDDATTTDKSKSQPISRKLVKVDFVEHGGHLEWIDVESDRVAKAGRFTSEAEQQGGSSRQLATNGGSNEAKIKPATVAKKGATTEVAPESTKLCVLPGFGACGLTNLGNTCYMNSALQCISYLPLLRSYLLSSQYKATGDINKDNPLGTGGKLLEESAELLRVIWSARVGEKSPNRFRSHLGRYNSQYSGADQQDAQEFLNYMLDVLHEDSNKIRQKPYVEALEDDWVKQTSLSRVGDESWRRFLRRNRSIMADVAMGQVLNTVTCPECNFSSRNFDPFNLLSIPIPTVAHVVFKCTVIRRATAWNCPWILDRPRRGDKKGSRFLVKSTISPPPPSTENVVEQYVLSMSRLADSGDLRLQLQNICGIPAARLKLCRIEEAEKDDENSQFMKVVPLADKDGPCSALAKKRGPNEAAPGPTLIVAFEHTLQPRSDEPEEKAETVDETTDEEEDDDAREGRLLPTSKERAEIEKTLQAYGDDKECRLVDTDPLSLTKAISRSLWPRSEQELKLGLRVDAKDHRGNWFPGSVVEVVNEQVNGVDTDSAEEVAIPKKKVRVHFDNFASRWDETIEQFDESRIRPVYSHTSPKAKPVEFFVHHRFIESETSQIVLFGQSFYVQCHNDWSTARAGAHILAQASRFLNFNDIGHGHDSSDWGSADGKVQRLYEKTQVAISDLIDLLTDCDREYARLALGLSDHNKAADKSQPFRNPAFDVTSLSTALVEKVNTLLRRLPFELRICLVDHSHAPTGNNKEDSFPFSLIRTIANYMHARNGVVLHWREPPADKTAAATKSGVRYIEPDVQIHKASAEILKNSISSKSETGKKGRPGSAGLDLGVCLTEFCKVQKLSISDNWRCPRCKEFREGQQNMNLWRLPDILMFHIKRFNMSARWREKITTKVNFPLTGLDISEWCHQDSPVLTEETSDSHVYDLIGVMNHYGSLTGGHYVASCKATACSRDGREEVAYTFNGVGVSAIETEDAGSTPGWAGRLGRAKTDNNQGKVAAAFLAKAASESAEPTWLQFDDELVEPIPPHQVTSEMAYVLFYRRRRITPSNIAKYSTLE